MTVVFVRAWCDDGTGASSGPIRARCLCVRPGSTRQASTSLRSDLAARAKVREPICGWPCGSAPCGVSSS